VVTLLLRIPEIPAWRPATLTDIFRDFSVTPSEFWDGTLKLCHDCFLPSPFTHHSLIVLSFDAVLSYLNASLYKLQINKQNQTMDKVQNKKEVRKVSHHEGG
jgi:hypothetical protein